MIDAPVAQLAAVLGPNAWWLVPMAVLVGTVCFPMPRRGPDSTSRDVWRGFVHAPRRTVLARAGDRCEAPGFLVWGRCPAAAAQVDHVFPWSRGGPTVVANGQALCAAHNRSKGALNPPWWYVLGLERRRRSYFPAGADVRVFAVMSAADTAARVPASGRGSRVRGAR